MPRVEHKDLRLSDLRASQYTPVTQTLPASVADGDVEIYPQRKTGWSDGNMTVDYAVEVTDRMKRGGSTTIEQVAALSTLQKAAMQGKPSDVLIKEVTEAQGTIARLKARIMEQTEALQNREQQIRSLQKRYTDAQTKAQKASKVASKAGAKLREKAQETPAPKK